MTVARMAISLDAELARAVKKAAGKEPTSAWFADAARKKLRAQGLLEVVSEWEEEHGVLDEPSAQGKPSVKLSKAARRPRPNRSRRSA